MLLPELAAYLGFVESRYAERDLRPEQVKKQPSCKLQPYQRARKPCTRHCIVTCQKSTSRNRYKRQERTGYFSFSRLEEVWCYFSFPLFATSLPASWQRRASMQFDVAQLLLCCGVPLLLAVWYLRRTRVATNVSGKIPNSLEVGYSHWTGHIGYIVSHNNVDAGQYAMNLYELVGQAPEPVMALHLYGPKWLAKPVYTVTDPELIAAATMSSKTTRFQSLERSVGTVMGKKALAALRGEELKRHRKLLASSVMSRKALDRFVELTGDVTEAFLQTLQTQPQAGQSSIELDLLDDCPVGIMMVDVFSQYSFGLGLSASLSDKTPEDVERRQHLHAGMNILFDAFAARVSTAGPLMFLSYINYWQNRKIADVHQFFRDELVLPAIRERQHDIQEGLDVPNDALTLMLTEGDDEVAAFTEDEIVDEAMLMMVVSYETTANTILWVFYHLALNPECQQRCYEEVRGVMSSYPQGTVPSLSDLDQMTYLHGVMDETNRLTPITRTVSREVVEDLPLRGYVVPKDHTLLCFSKDPAKCEEVFDNAGQFLPDRWLNDPKGGAKKPGTHSLAFGNGPFRCFGKPLAVQALRSVFAVWVQRYRFELVTEDVKPRFRIAYHPTEMVLRMFPREAAH
ncbi:cytochrome P450 3A24-like [Sycon ciliatum]|uniref:cytochrome P450 3A24-like n=1 Tax=Sycon ciliatum TaxID=27933 RepID=UPI0031F6E779